MTSMHTIGKFSLMTPGTLAEATALLAAGKNGTRILAGGTDVIVQMKYQQVQPSVVLDIKKIPETNCLGWNEAEGLHLGAAVAISRLLAFKTLTDKYAMLAQACSLIGSTQIKNRATVGGNICNAAPSADSAPALFCLDARVRLESATGSRIIPIEDFFLGPGETALRDNELLVDIHVPTPPAGSAGYYQRHTTREEMDISVAGAGSFITLSPETGQLKAVRIALGAVAATPIRAHRAEAIMTGQTATLELIEKAAETAATEARPISDIRGSAEYRCELVKVLTRRTLKACCGQLGITV